MKVIHTVLNSIAPGQVETLKNNVLIRMTTKRKRKSSFMSFTCNIRSTRKKYKDIASFCCL